MMVERSSERQMNMMNSGQRNMQMMMSILSNGAKY